MTDHPDGESTDFIRQRVADDVKSGSFGRGIRTRFPPEPNGHLHIGHAKSICLNFDIATEFDGICSLRFDDTNPTTEEASFAQGIVDDLRWLGYEPAQPILYASDYFDQLFEWALDLCRKGLAYVDEQDAETISHQRGSFGHPGIESPFRDRPKSENVDLFSAMRAGDVADGAMVLRARIDMAHENFQMRDPVLYRIRREHHIRTGDEWIIFPTYDWAHGQSDAIEGVTHSLCTLEFDDHRELYDWFLATLDLEGPPPRQIEFARLNLTHTVTSKRSLRRLVDDGTVDGWDDAVLPTLAGLRRRGYPPGAIRDFMSYIGVARTNSVHDIELLESFVRTELNRTAARRLAVLDPLKVTITNWPDGEVVELDAVNNPEDPSAGTRPVSFTGDLWIEQDDFKAEPPPKYYRLSLGREVRLRAGYYVTAHDIVTDDQGRVTEVLCTYDPETRGGSSPDGRKVRSTIHWVSAPHAMDATVRLYDRLFLDSHPGAGDSDPLESLNGSAVTTRHAKVEASLSDVAPGEVVQFERLGYFAKDLDAVDLFHRTVGLRDEWANIQKRK